jgi:hypothetical protein
MAESKPMNGSFVRLEGQWQQARSRFRGLSVRLNLAARAGLKNDAQQVAERIRHNILSRNYDGVWAPLAPSTVQRKSHEGKDDRTLIEDKDYVDHIEAIHLGGGRWGIGIREGGDHNVEKAFTHEFGSVSGAAHVPARPHFRVEVERYLAGGARRITIADAMGRVLSGGIRSFSFPLDEEE